MKIALILGHPHQGSFNHAIAETAAQTLKSMGHDVLIHDLYQEKFDPRLHDGEEKAAEADLPEFLRNYIDEVRNVQGLVFVHPNWWGGPPAILRGWIERVLRTGSVYNFTANGPVSYIGDKIVQILSTSNTPRDIEMNVNNNPVANFWKVIVFGILGSKSFEHRNFESIILSTLEERQRWLSEVEETIRRRFVF